MRLGVDDAERQVAGLELREVPLWHVDGPAQAERLAVEAAAAATSCVGTAKKSTPVMI